MTEYTVDWPAFGTATVEAETPEEAMQEVKVAFWNVDTDGLDMEVES